MSPVMTIRVHIAKSLNSICSIERYTSIIPNIFNNYLDTQYLSLKDNNSIHGLFEILNNFVEKHFDNLPIDFVLTKLDTYCSIEQ
jgi:hypothetical protein